MFSNARVPICHKDMLSLSYRLQIRLSDTDASLLSYNNTPTSRESSMKDHNSDCVT